MPTPTKSDRNSNLLLSFSPWMLAVACTLLLLLLAVFTVSNYQREKELINEALIQKSLTLIRFINSSAREAMRDNRRSGETEMRWQSLVQAAMEQAVEQPGVESVLLVDSAGKIVAEAGLQTATTTIDAETQAFIRLLHPEGQPPFISRIVRDGVGTKARQKFQVVSWHVPPNAPGRDSEIHGRGPGRGWMTRRFANNPQMAAIQEQMNRLAEMRLMYVVQLDFEQFTSSLRRQFLQVVILSIVTLLVGIGGALSYMTLRGLRGSQQSLGKLEKELQRSERLAALGKMAAGVAHELRNPLSSIKGLAVLLQSHLSASGKDAETAEMLVKEVERLNRSIGELLDYAKPGQLKREPTAIAEVIRKTVSLIQVDAESYGISITLGLADDLPPVQIDPDKLNQVLLNLLLNALQAMPDGGELSVRTAREGRMLVIAITDSGVGISPENLQRVFDPYFTTKSDGTGLGLAMSAKIVEEHGGAITISSVPDEHTEVRVLLPL